MTAIKRPTKEEARYLVQGLVDKYALLNPDQIRLGSEFSETDLRTQFIDPMLAALGWDVSNVAGQSRSYMEVVTERSDKDQDGVVTGRPDYKLRLNGLDVMPVEVKRPAIDLEKDRSSSNQARSYGWSLSLPASTLSNFKQTVIFDTSIATPAETDSPGFARIPGATFDYTDYVERFDELWRYLSFESLSTDGLEEIFGYEAPPRGESSFDRSFLSDFRRWRLKIATMLAQENNHLSAQEIGRRVQKILNALLFLRVCEDRAISKYKNLYESASNKALIEAFRRADKFYNAGLFTVLEQTQFSDDALLRIIEEMYWPSSQYAFGLLDSQILSELYEQYLGERVAISSEGIVTLETKPEVMHTGGVVSTPYCLVKEIVKEALQEVPPDLFSEPGTHYKILDPATGSGLFLIEAFRQLIEQWEAQGFTVNFEARRRLVVRIIFGIDIDPAAVEVARLSLLLLIIGEDSINIDTADAKLPSLDHNVICGNSVIGDDFDGLLPDLAADIVKRSLVKPTNIFDAFRFNKDYSGFDLIIGNPPYVRIQDLVKYLPDQLAYFKHPESVFESSRSNSFDLYQLFIERALSLLSARGYLSMVIPNRFINNLAGATVRSLLAPRITKITHFRENQLFPGRSVYVAIVLAGPKSTADVKIEFVDNLGKWRRGEHEPLVSLDRKSLSGSPWALSTESQQEAFEQLCKDSPGTLGEQAGVEIFVGVQTSSDDIYFINPVSCKDGIVSFIDSCGDKCEIEAEILLPALKDSSIDVYGGQPLPDRYVIFPYSTTTGKKAIAYSQVDLVHRFPKAWAYFNKHRALLEKRAISGGDPAEFWRYGRSQSLLKMAGPKLIVRVLSLEPRYAVDRDGLVVPGGGDGGPYYLLRTSTESNLSLNIIQAVLSYPIVDLYVAVTGKRFRGSYAVHRKEYLAKVPLPTLTEADSSRLEANAVALQRLSEARRTETDSEVLASIESRFVILRAENNRILTAAYGVEPSLYEKLT